MQPPWSFCIGATFVTSIYYNVSVKWFLGCLILSNNLEDKLMVNDQLFHKASRFKTLIYEPR